MSGKKGMKNNGMFIKGKSPWNKNIQGYRKGIPRIKPNSGWEPWNKGKKGFLSGDKHYNWKGGISKVDKLIRQIHEYKLWRSQVFQRDNWTCQTCGIRGVYMEAHHIEELHKIIEKFNISSLEDARNIKELWDTNNGVTLCLDCHCLTKGRFKKKCTV